MYCKRIIALYKERKNVDMIEILVKVRHLILLMILET